MKITYEATISGAVRDFDSKDAAQTFVEQHGEGRVVMFVRDDVEGRDRSCAMIVYDGKKWRGVDISR